MPEGDSYARAATRMRAVLADRVVVAVDGIGEVRRRSERILGRRVEAVRTHGKHVMVDLDSGWTVHVWLGMPGRVVVTAGGRTVTAVGEARAGDAGPARLRLVTDAGVVSVHAAPVIEVERTPVVDRSLGSLGADVLAEPFDWDLYLARAALVDPGRPVAGVLLDQRVLAGVGNEYKNEILFLERIHPGVPFGSLSPEAIRGLATRASRLMRPNVGRGARSTTGSTRRASTTWVYDRAGRPCRRCRSRIESARMGDPHPRVTFWCPTCQPAP